MVDSIRRDAFSLIRDSLRSQVPVSEYFVQQFIRKKFVENNLLTDHGPIVAVNSHASSPHYEPSAEKSAAITLGDLVLIDLWAKLEHPNAVFYDSTWIGFCGNRIAEPVQRVFNVVRDARKRACQFVIEAVKTQQEICGWQVDQIARNYITELGFGDYILHRTGHSIGIEVHGTGANMDNLESHDERLIIANTCFSIEPGIYLPDFGIRSEVDVFVGSSGAFVTGEEQESIVFLY